MFKITTKGCQVSDRTRRRIYRHLAKVTQFLPDVEEDLIVFRLVIKKNIDRYHPQKTRSRLHKYADVKPELAYFEGSITLRLNKKQLFVHFKGQTIDECVNLGFERIFDELKKHKDLHFSAESEYPDHSSIRRR